MESEHRERAVMSQLKFAQNVIFFQIHGVRLLQGIFQFNRSSVVVNQTEHSC